MDKKEQKHRFVLLVDREIFEQFKNLASAQNRTAGNLGTTLINEFVKKNSKPE